MSKKPVMTAEEHTNIFKVISETVTRSDTQLPSEAVKRGAAKLDRMHPSWFTKIDLSRFDISDATACVFGQVYGDYDSEHLQKIFRLRPKDGETEYELEIRREKESVACGFNTGEGGEHSFNKLQGSWVKAIRSRQEAYAAATARR